MNVAIIPARGGSRRIPRKNIKLFHGKPIIAYSIETARESGVFHQIFVSTEDEQIADVAMEYGAEWLPRDAQAAADEVGTQEVMKLDLEYLREVTGLLPDRLCCIYPCAPMMTAHDLKGGLESLLRHGSFIFVPGWYYWGTASAFLSYTPLTNPMTDEEIRALTRKSLGQSIEGRWIDIDTPSDWETAEKMYAALHI